MLCWAGKCMVPISIYTFCCCHQTKTGFPLLNSTCAKYKKEPFRVQTKTERVSICERNAKLCVYWVFTVFLPFLHCLSRRFSSLLWELSSVCHLSSKNLLRFSGSLKLRFTFTRKPQKVFWFEMPNSHCCAMKLNSHSALLNLLDSQCKTSENQSKLIAHTAVHFSRSFQHVPFLFFHGNISF